jgi:NADH-quinone oxidoreductase subunit A
MPLDAANDVQFAQYASVALLLGLAILTAVGMLLIARFLAPRNPTTVKGETYECGEVPIGTAWLRFNVRFFVIALVFVLFDVEIALVYPVACVFRSVAHAPGVGSGALLVFAELAFFMGVLLLGLIYVWRKGDLDWLRTYRPNEEAGLRSWDAPASLKAPAPADAPAEA